ncbi:MAG TPA: cobalamin-binding protein [Vicinamibacteria bacterium]
MKRRRQSIALLLGLLTALLVACGGAQATTPAGGTPTPSVRAAVGTSASPVAVGGAPATAGSAPASSGGGTPATPGSAASPAGTPRATAYPLTVRDDAGREVTLPARPRRFISLAPSNTEILYALGLGDRVVGVDRFSDYPEAARARPQIGGFATTNIEEVVALAPDLVLATGIHAPDYLATLAGKGLRVVVLSPPDLPGVLANISLVGRLADENAAAAALRAGLEARLAAVDTRLRGAPARPRVFLELDPTDFFTAGPRSFQDDLIGRAGGANIAADAATPFPQLSPEAIIARDPEVIVLTDAVLGATPDAVRARPGWAGISAVRDGRIVAIDPSLASRPGPRVFDALEQLARAFHPELFR